MKQHTLLLPATIPQEQPLRQLLLLFEDIFLYSPCEDDGQKAENNAPIRQYAPVPFADDLPKFKQLIKDMTRNPADYYGGGLSALSSSMSPDVDESTVWQLIQQMAPAQAENNEGAKILYQARLLLKLAELQEQQDEEIDHGLEEINHRSSQLMAALKGDEEACEALSAITSPPRQAINSNAMRQRLTAWGHLFLADPQAAQFPILTTGNDEFELLSDHAGSNILAAPKKLYSLVVPDFAMSPQSLSDFYLLRDEFRKATNLADIFSELDKVASNATIDEQIVDEQQKAWHQQIDKYFSDLPQKRLDIYLFPNLSLPELMAKICRVSLRHEMKDNFPAHGLLVVSC